MAEENSKKVMPIEPMRMRLAEYERQDWVANAPENTDPEDLKDPAFWSHMASNFKPYDRIEVRADDGSWIAECRVLMCERTWAKVAVLHVHKLSSVSSAKAPSKYRVEFKGPHRKWSVIRGSDGEYVKDGLNTKDDADTWLRDHEKNLQAA